MALQTDIQKALFENIRSRLSSHLSMVDEIADLLFLSLDSAYRRIRGDKPLSLFEAVRLARHYNLSLDNLYDSKSEILTFESFQLDEDDFSFHKYLRSILIVMEKIRDDPTAEIILQQSELNLFQTLQFPEILSFKIYFWSKSGLDYKSFSDRRYSLLEIDDSISSLCKKVVDYYVKMNSTELIAPGFLSTFLKQLKYLSMSGQKLRSLDVVLLCNQALELIEHLRKQSELGYKFTFGSEPSGSGGRFKLYYNNLNLIDNIILLNANKQGVTYLANGSVNLITSTNQDFYQRNYKMVKNTIRRSVLISENAEPDRTLFFNRIRDRIIKVRERLKYRHFF